MKISKELIKGSTARKGTKRLKEKQEEWKVYSKSVEKVLSFSGV